MTAQQFVGIGVRLFAIWLLVSAIGRLFYAVGLLLAPSVGDPAPSIVMQMITFGFAALELSAAVVLWLFPLSIAGRLIPRTHHTDTLRVRLEDTAAVGCALLGLWTLANALPQVAHWLGYGLLAARRVISFSGQPVILDALYAGTQLAVALLLLGRARMIAKWMMRVSQPVRESRTNSTDEEGTSA